MGMNHRRYLRTLTVHFKVHADFAGRSTIPRQNLPTIIDEEKVNRLERAMPAS